MVRTLLFIIGMYWLGAVSAQDRKSVLFIGNSYCFVNDFAEITEDISTSMGDTLDWVNFYKGAAGLERFWEMPACIQRLDSLPYDVIFIQEFHLTSSYPEAYFDVLSIPYADSFIQRIDSLNPCAETYITMPWAKEEGNVLDCATDVAQCTYEGLLGRSVSNFQRLRRETGATISPVGVVWDEVMQLYPWIDLYAAHDRSHPNIAGSYLYACIQYALAFKKSPVGAWVHPTLPQEVGEILQQATWDVLTELESEWGYKLSPYNGNQIVVKQSVNGSYKISNKVPSCDSFWWEIDGQQVETPAKTLLYTPTDNCRHDIGLFIVMGCDTLENHEVIASKSAHAIIPTVFQAACPASTDGNIDVSITKVVQPLSFAWSDGSTEADRHNIPAGTYTVTVINGDGCTASSAILVTSLHESNVEITAIADCAGGQSGKAIATCPNCIEPVSWAWSDGQQASIIENLGSGTYTLTAIEANGCQHMLETFIDTGSICTSVGLFEVSNITDTSFTVQWISQPCAENYIVMWKHKDSTAFLQQTVSGNISSYIVSGLLSGTDYKTRVRSVCHEGVGNTSWKALKTHYRIFYDYDRDGFGNDAQSYHVDEIKSNYALVGGDCLESDSTAYPGAPEYCDLVDNNCNGIVDEGATTGYTPLSPYPMIVCEDGIELYWPEQPCATSYEIRIKSLSNGNSVDYSFPATTTNFFYVGGFYGDSIVLRIRHICGDSASNWSLWRQVEITNHPYIVTSNVDTLGFTITTPSTAPCQTNSSSNIETKLDEVITAKNLTLWTLDGRCIGLFYEDTLQQYLPNLPSGVYFIRQTTDSGALKWNRFMKI